MHFGMLWTCWWVLRPNVKPLVQGAYLSCVFKFCLVAASPSIIRFFMLQKSCRHPFEVGSLPYYIHGFTVVPPLSTHDSHGFYRFTWFLELQSKAQSRWWRRPRSQRFLHGWLPTKMFSTMNSKGKPQDCQKKSFAPPQKKKEYDDWPSREIHAQIAKSVPLFGISEPRCRLLETNKKKGTPGKLSEN